MSKLLVFSEQIAHSLFCWQKRVIHSNLLTKTVFWYVFCTFYVLRVIRSSPLFYWAMWANCLGCPPKMNDVSKLLRSLTKNERPWVICPGCSPKMSESLFFLANHSFAHFFAKNKQFAQRTDERIPNPEKNKIKFIKFSHSVTIFLIYRLLKNFHNLKPSSKNVACEFNLLLNLLHFRNSARE